MNQQQYFKECGKVYAEGGLGVFIAIILIYFNILPLFVTCSLLAYELASLAFNIGALKSLYRPKEIRLNKMV